MSIAIPSAGVNRTPLRKNNFHDSVVTDGTGRHPHDVPPIHRVLACLTSHGCEPRETKPGQWDSKCPSHKGSKRNLSIGETSDGTVVLHCHHVDEGGRNCPVPAIMQAIGLEMKDLFPSLPSPHDKIPAVKTTRSPSKVAPPTKRKPDGKGYPSADAAFAVFRKSLGKPTAVWIYRNEEGDEIAAAARFDPAGEPRKTFRTAHRDVEAGLWRLSDPPGLWPLYRLPRLLESRQVYLFEGERCADIAAGLGIDSTTTSHGAESPHKTDLSPLAGRDVVIIPDHDAPGEGYASQVANLLSRIDPPARVKVVRLPGLVEDGDDIEQWVEAGGTYAGLLTLVESAPYWGPLVETEATRIVVEDRPQIVVTVEAHEVIDQAVAVLATDAEVYQRGHALVRVIREPARAAKIGRPVGTPRISVIPGPTLLEKLSRSASWSKPKVNRNGDVVLVPALPPDWCIAGVAARAEWQGVRPLEAVIEAPTLRPDGTVLDRPGYDEETGLLYIPNDRYPPIPARPTLDDARKAAGILIRLVGDFPFAVMTDAGGKSDEGSTHRSAWLSAVLTILARFAIDGPTPLTVFDATTPGSGKTLLAELVSRISTGRPMPRTAYPDSDDELRKRITSIALEGDRLVLLDNVATTFGGPALDAALTGTTWRDRILGRNEMTAELPLHAVWFASGNNLQFRGDVLRRIVHCRLEPSQERPEERDPASFAIKIPLAGYVTKNRPELVAAGLTIVRAYVVAGRPDQKLTAVDFREWSDLVRSAIYWTIGADPCASRRDLVATDGDSADRAALVDGWAELPMAERGVTTGEALRILRDNPAQYSTLRSVILTRSGELPSTKVLGKMLAKVRGRVVGGRAIQSVDAGKNTLAWKVTPTQPGGFGGFGGFPLATPCENALTNVVPNRGEPVGNKATKATKATVSTWTDPECSGLGF